MKILVVNKFFYQKGGSERVFFEERAFLMSHGFQIFDFAMQHEENLHSDCLEYFIPYFGIGDAGWKKRRGKIATIIDGVKFVSNYQARRKIKALVDEKKPDIAHLHNIYHQLTPSIIPVLGNAGVRTVLTLHDYKLLCPAYYMLRHGNICNRCNGKGFWNAIWSRCKDGSVSQSLLLALEAYWNKIRGHYGKIDVFISPSRFLADLVANSGYGFKNIEIIPNGIDLEQYRPSFRDEGYGLFLGRLTAQKGIKTLLKAYGNIIGSGPGGLKLKIVGDGPLLKEMQERFKKVEFKGYKSGEELRDLIDRSAFVVVPSEGYENCSMSVLEAMAMGKPVIASDIGGLPEQVENGKTGFLFEMGNAEDLAEKMTILARDEGLRLEMGKAAREKVEKVYSFEVHGQKLMALYERLLAGEYS